MNQPIDKVTDALSASVYRNAFQIICAVLVCCFAIYYYGLILLRLAMWGTVVAAVGVGSYVGYLASRQKVIAERNKMWMFCGGSLVIGALVWFLIPATGTRSDANAAYWAELIRISRKAETFGHSVASTNPANVEAAAAQVKKFFHDLADDISQLPTTLVDPELIAFAADTVQAVRESELLFEDMLNLFKQAGALNDRAFSASMLFQSFVRGVLGDPLATYNEFKGSAQQIGGKWDQVQARRSSIQQTFAALDARELKLRAMLSEKYHRDFPPLSKPKKP